MEHRKCLNCGGSPHLTGKPLDSRTDCPLCWLWYNGKWPDKSKKFPESAGVKPKVCGKLALQVVQIPGAVRRDWRKCLGGYGSKPGDVRDTYVSLCSSPAPRIWRIHQECSSSCPGYEKPPDE